MEDRPPRGPYLPGTFILPDPVEEEGRLVFREPLGDTLLPLAVMGSLDLACCTGIAFAESWARMIFLVGAAGLSFLVAALAYSLLHRPEVVLDRAAGRIRIRRPEDGTRGIPVDAVRAVTIETVTAGAGITAPGAGLELRDGAWIPLHVAWTERRGGDSARVRARGEAVATHLGLPLEGGNATSDSASPG